MDKSSSKSYHSRLAPTPSGFLHLGNAVNFVLTWIITRATNGTVSLRIDDMDANRSKPEYIQDIFESLEWLKLDYEFGPKSADDFIQNFSQQKRIEHYRQSLRKLDTYACNCSRKEIQELSTDGLYPKTCLNKNLTYEKDKTSLRIKAVDGVPLGDFIIWRKDDLPSYQLVSLIEDSEANIDLIVRGEDLLNSTDAQIFLANQLSLSNFTEVKFVHHKLLVDSTGAKLSKSEGANSLKYLRQSGTSPNIVYNEVAKLLSGSEHSIKSLRHLREFYANHPYSR
jgi:glutamyl/glutaminyl-tRNA synthetase